MISKERLKNLMNDTRLKTRIKIENLLLVNNGVRPCSQTVFPIDLPNAQIMGSKIDKIMTPKMSLIQKEQNTKRRIAAISKMKKEMRLAYDEVVKSSEQYNAHLLWAKNLDLRKRIIDVRPTVQELYLFRERSLDGKLKDLMKKRQKIRAKAYANATPEIERIRLAYPEEFDGPWLKNMGKTLGYPDCCVDAYISDRKANQNVELRAAKQLEVSESLGAVDLFAYFVGYFFPCKPDCNAAQRIGRKFLKSLKDLEQSLGELYVSILAENMDNIRRQPDIISQYTERAESRPGLRK